MPRDDELWISDELADEWLQATDDVEVCAENRRQYRVMMADRFQLARLGFYAGRCPVCDLIVTANLLEDLEDNLAGLVKIRLHTYRNLVAHIPADLITGQRDLVMPCIGSRSIVHPYIGAKQPGEYAPWEVPH